jgi:hypothetical protein
VHCEQLACSLKFVPRATTGIVREFNLLLVIAGSRAIFSKVVAAAIVANIDDWILIKSVMLLSRAFAMLCLAFVPCFCPVLLPCFAVLLSRAFAMLCRAFVPCFCRVRRSPDGDEETGYGSCFLVRPTGRDAQARDSARSQAPPGAAVKGSF